MITLEKQMTKTEFMTKLREIVSTSETYENPRQGTSVFRYAAWCEHNFEINLEENTLNRRKWTFFSDISIAEWYGIPSVEDTLIRCFKAWLHRKDAIAELLISINYKAWEMHTRGLFKWSTYYSDIYDRLYNLVMDYYEDNNTAAAEYVADYLD